jgi:hypothetical protein
VRYRARRAVRAAAWRARRWWDRWPLELLTLEQEIPPEYASFARGMIGNALVYRGTVHVDTVGVDRRLAIIFPGRPSKVTPIVMADGPTRSRHRFYWTRPSSLCLWYAGDPPSMRWTLRDGLVGLIDLSRVHLVKEAWWRVTGEWPGPERHREPPRGDEQRPRNPKPSRVDNIRLERRRCWCGRGRYKTCHGGIDSRRELEELGIA